MDGGERITSVWVPYGERYVDWKDHPGWEPLEVDFEDDSTAWFFTREACQAWCDKLNEEVKKRVKAQYLAYVQRIEREYSVAFAKYEVYLRENEVLVKAGLREENYPLKPRPEKEQIKPIEEWSRWRDTGPRWWPQEFKRCSEDVDE